MTIPLFLPPYRSSTVWTLDSINSHLSARRISCIEFSNSVKTKSLFKCQCGQRWSTQAASVLRGGGCPGCAHNAPEATAHRFKEAARLARLAIISYGGSYKKASRLRCSKGHEFSTRSENVVRGSKCPLCAGRQKTVESINAVLRQVSSFICVEYSGRTMGVDSTFRCMAHDRTWSCTWNALACGSVRGCQECPTIRLYKSRSRKSWDTASIGEEIRERGIICIAYPGTTSAPSEFRCAICGHTWNATWNSVQRGRGCPACAMARSKQKLNPCTHSMTR